jgi:hypothetical protein
MGRIQLELDVDGKKCWTLFDSGARNSYITVEAAAGLSLLPVKGMRKSALGGREHQVTHVCHVPTSLDGHALEIPASVVDEIGPDENGRRIDILFGALAMQQWNVKLDVPNERLDLTHLTHDFVEF